MLQVPNTIRSMSRASRPAPGERAAGGDVAELAQRTWENVLFVDTGPGADPFVGGIEEASPGRRFVRMAGGMHLPSR